MARRQRRRRRLSGRLAGDTGERRAKPPFPVNLIWNSKILYVVFIMAMIGGLGAVGLAPGLGSTSTSRQAEIVDEENLPEIVETPEGLPTFPEPQPVIDATKPHKAIIQTNRGPIEIELFTDAPQAVDSFAFLAGQNFYDNQIFFYVKQEFVAQAGDPACNKAGQDNCTGIVDAGYTLPLEQTKVGHEQWAVVAPATVGGDEVHGGQFRILLRSDPRLDGKETVFGKVVSGQQILQDVGNFVPCSVDQTDDDCDPDPDVSSALIIVDIVVQPA